MAKSLYVAYLSGKKGLSFAMFCIGDGALVGADVGGLHYDGTLQLAADGSLEGIVRVAVPAGVPLISGISSDKKQIVSVPIVLLPHFDDGETITRIETPVGPINARFECLRGLP